MQEVKILINKHANKQKYSNNHPGSSKIFSFFFFFWSNLPVYNASLGMERHNPLKDINISEHSKFPVCSLQTPLTNTSKRRLLNLILLNFNSKVAD